MCRSRRDDCLDAKEALLADKYRIVILVLAMLLGQLLGSEPGSRRAFGLFGQVAGSVVTGLPLAEIPLTTADPGVGLIPRTLGWV